MGGRIKYLCGVWLWERLSSFFLCFLKLTSFLGANVFAAVSMQSGSWLAYTFSRCCVDCGGACSDRAGGSCFNALKWRSW